jgi:RHS repeat-associated protein
MAGARRFRLSIASVLVLSLLAFGLPEGLDPQTAAAATQSDPIRYVYDQLGRLRGVIDPAAGAAIYSYDAAGNLLSISRQSVTTTSIIEFDPHSAPTGTSVTIYGTGFSSTAGQNTVRFNGVTATLTSATTTSIVATVPPGASTGPINVTSPNGSATSATPFTVGATNAPTISGFSPTIGTPGTPVTISGTNFETSRANNVVAFNETRAQVTGAAPTSISAAVPPATSGKVSVYTPNGKAVSPDDFFVPPAPYAAADVAFTGRVQFGVAKAVTINTAGKIGMVLFDGTENQRISVKTDNSTNGWVTVAIRKPDGSTLASVLVTGSSGFIDATTLPVAGTYTVLVDPNGAATGTTTLTVYDVPPDLTGTITPTPSGAQVAATINTPGQNAGYTFAGSVGQRISVKIAKYPIGYVTVAIRKPDGSTLASVLVTADSGFIDATTLPVAGTYTVVVDPNGAVTDTITVTTYDVPPDLSGTITPTPSGVQVAATINTPGQNAGYTFAGSVGQRISVKIAKSPIGYVTVAIRKPDGSTLASVLVTAASGFIEPATLPVAGTYTILVDPSGAVTDTITLNVYDVPPDLTRTIRIGGPALTVTMSTPGQNANVTFTGTTSKHIALQIGNSTTGWVNVTIKKPDGSTLASATVTGASGSITATLPVKGTFTIVVDPIGAATGSVTLTLTDPPGGGLASIDEDAASTAFGHPLEGRGSAQSLAQPTETPATPAPRPETGPSANGHKVRPSDSQNRDGANLLGIGDSNGPGPEEWSPGPANYHGYWQTGLADSTWLALPPLFPTVVSTSLAGQVLDLRGEPLADVTLSVGDQKTTSDKTGRFLLESLPAGHQVLHIDGTTANRPGRTYGTFEAGVDLKKDEPNVLPYTIWMTRIDTSHAQTIPSPTTEDVALTTPRIPGLEVVIPAGSVVKDEDGEVVTELGITAVPTDRPPFPLPSFFETPVYFTVQPGGAYVFPKGARIIYPNYTNQLPGARVEFWNYDPDERGWHIYGHGTVTADGKRIVPDPGVRVYEFSGAMINSEAVPPDKGPKCSWWARTFGGCTEGDPVDPQTGLFANHVTDLHLPGPMPITLTRAYRQGDTSSRAFGLATNFTYGMFLWSAQQQQYQQADLIMPDGARVHYVRISPGITWTDAVFESTSVPGPFYKSKIVWNGNGWDLTLKDGTVFVFGENAPLQAIRDRYGNQITITRTNGQSGNITTVSSTGGRWITFTYDSGNRITQAQDNMGRTVAYSYDSNGRLTQVTDANGGITTYGWGPCPTPGAASCNQMTTITDPRNVLVLTNTYDGNGKVATQTLGDGQSTYSFAYTPSSGEITQADVTDPRGKIHRMTFNADGYMTGETRALGTADQQSITYDRQAGTGLLNGVTDALGRTTAYQYDAKGNVTSITRLSGTGQAVTTSFTYEPAFNQMASITDPLNHTTTLGHDAKGSLTSVTDAENRTSTFTYNGAGQVRTAADPLGRTWTYAYTLGDVTSVTDPLGRETSRFVDSGGRVVSVTDPLGHRTVRDYDGFNQLLKVTDPLGGMTSFAYDGAGNLRTVTDARNNLTTFTYDNMDRLATRKDSLNNIESYEYDRNSNLVKVTDRKGQVTTFSYDGLNRRIFAGFGTSGSTYSSTISYTYDAGNRITSIADSRGGTITRTFDGLDRLTQEVTPNSPASGVQYAYDAASRRQSMTVGTLSPVNYGYNNADQLTSVTQGSTSVGFTHDTAGREKTLTLPDGIVQTYGYDDASELTSIVYTKGATTLGDLAYGYDAAGRRTAIWGSYARTGLPAATTASASYNANNQLTSWNGTTLSYDLNGNLTGSGSQTFTWNDRNQLQATSAGSASFAYDGLDRRLSKTVGGTTTKFLYDGANVVQEQDSSNSATANLLTGLGIDQTFSRQVVGGATSSLLTDALGSTIALGDANGAVQTSYTYEPFGTATSSGATNTNSYQFTGRENDGTTGLYFNRARYYNPTFGRFISEDPLGFPGGPDPNLYAYVFDSPIMLVDPFGLDPGNGCGFLPFSCVTDLFMGVWSGGLFGLLADVSPIDVLRFIGDFAYGFYYGFVSAFRNLESGVLVAAGVLFVGGLVVSVVFPPVAPYVLPYTTAASLWLLFSGWKIAVAGGIVWGVYKGVQNAVEGWPE